MKRKRGETSLFEILRDPQEREGSPPVDLVGSGDGNRVRLELEALERSEPDTASPGSPRLSSLPPELRSSTSAAGTTAPVAGSYRVPRWGRSVPVPPAFLLVAAVGVVLVGLLSYQAGLEGGRAEGSGEAAPAAAWDPAEWQIHSNHPGEKAEIQRVVAEDGTPIGGVTAASETEAIRREVIVVSSRKGWEDPKVQAAAEDLALYIDGYVSPHRAQLKVLGDDLIVFLGPFESGADAQDYLTGIARKIPNKFGVRFREAYRHSITFTPQEFETARAGW
jgi:hypothetical protein